MQNELQSLSLFKDVRVDTTPVPSQRVNLINNNNLQDYRKFLLQEYRKSNKGILDKVKEGKAQTSDDLMNLIVQDLLQQAQMLYGNSLIFTEDGNLKDATTVSLKRSDLLKMIADILAKKRELNQKDADIDLNSPAFMIFQKMCFDKMMQSLKECGLQNQVIRIALNKWMDLMSDWGKELKKALLELK